MINRDINARLLRIQECEIYDAEFSVKKSNYRLNIAVVKEVQNLRLDKCIHQCTLHENCYSINYNKPEMRCEFLGYTTGGFKRNIEELMPADGWTYIETKFKKTVSFQRLIFCHSFNKAGAVPTFNF